MSINDLQSKLSFYTPPPVPLESAPAQSASVLGAVTGLFKPSQPQPVVQNDEETAGLMSWASSSVQNRLQSAKGAADDLVNARQRLTTFAMLAGAGVVCLIISFTFLPMMVISPHKFAMMFTLGSGLVIASFSVLRGHRAFIAHVSSMERLPFSGSYALSLVGTLYASLVMGSYLLTVIFSIIQIVALAYFLVSYIPGGTQALNFLGTMIVASVKSCIKK